MLETQKLVRVSAANSVADPGCLSRIPVFSNPDTIPTTKDGENIICFLTSFLATDLTNGKLLYF
jgi:hypothetical protein